ncbi:hypothetical protein [Streptomyces sp. UG1]|uniref:hypothetical protein n=1 Tax=Streptomyces sp. UG1 TaxID=3417652 RepID=UPI003CEE5DB2
MGSERAESLFSGVTQIDERGGVKDWATDREQAVRLWDLAAELTGVNAFAA